jgi:hypothetical protein
MTATATKERPLTCDAREVKAVLDGRQTQFRRVVKPPSVTATVDGKPAGKMLFDLSRAWADPGFPDEDGAYREGYLHVPCAHPSDGWEAKPHNDRVERVYCPFGSPGDHLWVRETFRAIEDPGAADSEVRRTYEDDGETRYIVVDYKADAPTRIMDKLGKPEWKPSIYMPRWASRITLEITGVKVERLRAISEADALAEGCDGCDWHRHPSFGICTDDGELPSEEFARLWDSINGKVHPWRDNPWTWVISFRRLGPAPA